MKKIKKLEIKVREVNNIGDVLITLVREMALMKKTINELIDYVEWLERKNWPVTSLDDPEENCKVCGHIHELVCKCGCPAVRVKKV